VSDKQKIFDICDRIYYTIVMDTDDLDFAIWWSDMKSRKPSLRIFELHHIEGWEVAELALKYQVSRSALKKKLKCARKYIERYYIERKIVVRRSDENRSPQTDKVEEKNEY
jgi:predicted DNA-binding protein YlxM (UPF0122 family)